MGDSVLKITIKKNDNFCPFFFLSTFEYEQLESTAICEVSFLSDRMYPYIPSLAYLTSTAQW